MSMADVAALVFDIDSTQARTAATDLAKVQNAAAGLSGEWAKTDRALRRTNGQFASSVEVVEKYGTEIQSLAREFNPALSAVYSFQQAEERLNRAVALGVVPLSQKAAALDRIRTSFATAATAQQKFGQSTEVARHHVMNLGYQVNDIGMMMALGQNPFALMMQQGPQVAQIFSQMNAEGRKIGPTLAGAFKTMLNPTTAVTLAVIGGSAAIMQWAVSAANGGKEAKSLDERLSDVANSASKLADINKYSGIDGIKAIGAAYGGVTKEIRELIEAQRFLAAEAGLRDLQSALGDIVDETSTFFAGAAVNLDKLFKATETSFGANIIRQLNEIKTSANFDEQIETLVQIRRSIELQAVSQGGLNAKQQEFLNKIVQSEDAARRLKAVADGLPASFNAAANAASRIADELNRAVSAAARLAASAVSDVRFAQIELDFRTDKIGKAAAIAAAKFDAEVGKAGMDQWLYNSLRNQAIEGAKETARIMGKVEELNKADAEKGKSGGGGGGRAAAELKAAEKGFQSLRELLEKESMFQVAEWQKRQAQLDQALAKKLLSEEQYQIMRQQLQAVYFGSEYERNLVQYNMDQDALQAALDQKLLTEEQYLMRRSQMQSDYYSNAIGVDQNRTSATLNQMSEAFGQMNSLAGGGYDSLLRAQKTFAAGSALINAYLAASQAMADPTVPYWMKIAAYAKVLAAGMGAVNAIKGGGSGGGSAGGGASSTPTATRTEPTRNILVRLEGPDFMVDMAESIMTQIYEQSSDGRVIISRDR